MRRDEDLYLLDRPPSNTEHTSTHARAPPHTFTLHLLVLARDHPTQHRTSSTITSLRPIHPLHHHSTSIHLPALSKPLRRERGRPLLPIGLIEARPIDLVELGARLVGRRAQIQSTAARALVVGRVARRVGADVRRRRRCYVEKLHQPPTGSPLPFPQRRTAASGTAVRTRHIEPTARRSQLTRRASWQWSGRSRSTAACCTCGARSHRPCGAATS